MSEKEIKGHERIAHSHEAGQEHHEHQERLKQHQETQAERARHEKSQENLAKIQEMAKAHAQEAEPQSQETAETVHADSLPGIQHTLKQTAYERVLSKTRQKLPKPAQTFSKVVHNETVEKVSAVGASTVSRPSGVLGGSICAFIGSLIVLYMSKHYGFRYNYLLLFVLFVGGFMIGSVVELSIWLVHGRKQRY